MKRRTSARVSLPKRRKRFGNSFPPTVRRLTIEPLEDRSLLSSISGHVFNDVDGNGFRGPVVAASGELRVNSGTQGDQYPGEYTSSVAADSQGNFVTVWSSWIAGENRAFGQRFSADNRPIGGEFPVSAATPGTQYYVSVAMTPTGEFVVVWRGIATSDAEAHIAARCFDSLGQPVGNELRVDSGTSTSQSQPRVAVDDAGNFIVAWSGKPTGQDYVTALVRRFNSQGVPLGGEVSASNDITQDLFVESCTMNAAGRYAVTWHTGISWLPSNVFAALYDANGNAVAMGFPVNTTHNAGRYQGYSSCAMDSQGGLLVTWWNGSWPTRKWSIEAQRFDAMGTRVGSGFQIDGPSTGNVAEHWNNSAPYVAVLPDGRFMIAWGGYGTTDLDNLDAYAQCFDSNDLPLGSEFIVSATTNHLQRYPVVAASAQGSFVVAWSGLGPGDDFGVYARRFALAPIEPGLADWTVFVDTDGDGVRDSGEPSATSDASGYYSLAVPPELSGQTLVLREVGQAGWLATLPRVDAYTGTPEQLATTSLNFGNTQTVPLPRISGRVFNDGTWDGVEDFDDGGLADQTVYLDTDNSGTMDAGEPAAVTDVRGRYCLDNLAPGDYLARLIVPTGTHQTLPAANAGRSITVQQGDWSTDADFGLAMPISISGKVWFDQDGDASMQGDNWEWGLEGWTVYLDANDNGSLDTGEAAATTAADGTYRFTDVSLGNHVVRQVERFGHLLRTLPAADAYRITLRSGDNPADVNFLNTEITTISGTVYADSNGDGRRGPFVTPLGGEIMAHQSADGRQDAQSALTTMASDAAGNFVIVWMYDVLGMDHLVNINEIVGRRFDSSGNPLGDEFTVNTTTAGNRWFPTVAMNAAGDFVVLWTQHDADGVGAKVFARCYDANGDASGGEVRVDSGDYTSQGDPIAGIDDSGAFVVAWGGIPQDSSLFTVIARRFDSQGNPLGPEFEPNPDGNGDRSLVRASVTMNGDGRCLITWHSGYAWYAFDAFGVLYDATGAVVRSDLSFGPGGWVSAAMDATGSFVATWTRQSEGADWEVFARRFDANGDAMGPEIHVNTTTAGTQYISRVASMPDGRFVVVWLDDSGNDGSGNGAFARCFDAAGQPLGGDFVASVTTDGWQAVPSVAAGPDGDFVVSWTGTGGGDPWCGVIFRRFRMALPEQALANWTVFLDGNNNGQLDPGETATTTDAAGRYSFADVQTLTHFVRVVVPPDWSMATPAAGFWGTRVTDCDFGMNTSTATGSLAGRVFRDSNGNGTWDSGERVRYGWQVFVDANDNGVWDEGEVSTGTSSTGNYRFDALFPDDYVIRLVTQDDWSIVDPGNGSYQITLAAGASLADLDFLTAGPGSISGMVFDDYNLNGVRDEEEDTWGDVTIYLDLNDNGEWDSGDLSVNSDVQGNYRFEHVAPGHYVVRESGFFGPNERTTTPAEGCHRISVLPETDTTDLDFGIAAPGQIWGYFFVDRNINGLWEDNDEWAEYKSFPVYLDSNNNGLWDPDEPQAERESWGNWKEYYSFPSVTPGTWIVREVVPAGWEVTAPSEGFYSVTVHSGEEVQLDFGNSPRMQIQVSLIPVLAPSSSSLPGADLPTALTSVLAGSTYYVEMWVQDTGKLSAAVGVTGGSVDVYYDTGRADVQSIIVDKDFTAIPTDGTVYDSEGLVDELGGGTLTAGAGTSPKWVRMAYLKVVATDEGDVVWFMEPGDMTFGRYGSGTVEWEFVLLHDSVAVQQIGGAEVDVTLVREPTLVNSVTGEVDILPESPTWIHEWEPYWVEVWLTRTDDLAGLKGGTVDLSYDTRYATATQIEYGPAFTANRTGTIDDAAGVIHNLGADTVRTDAGDGQPVLLARIHFEPTAADQAPVDEVNHYVGPYSLNVRIDAVRVRSVGSDVLGAVVGEIPSTVEYAVPYDIDDNDQIDFGDFSYFAAAFNHAIGNDEPPYTWWADFERGTGWNVGYGDLSIFAPSFGKGKPDAQVHLPPDFPNGWFELIEGESPVASIASTGGIVDLDKPFSASNISLPTGGRGRSLLGSWSSEIDVELRIVASPAASEHISDASFASYASITSVPWNSTYYAEVWLRDTGTIRGIVGGSVDLAYTTAVTDATEIDHGSQYNLFTSGTIDDPHGLVNNLGGGTLNSSEGTTQWVRLATTTFTSVATGDALFSVGHDLASGSANWQFAEMGAGNLDWSRVHFNSTPVTVHHAPLTVVNDPPVAIGDTWTVQENQTLAVGVPGVLSNDGDVNGDALSAVLVHSTTHGALQLHADGSFTYAPAEWFNREDSFQYYVDDGTDRSGTVTVTLVVQTAYPWHNGIQRFDVNDDGDISPSDVLTVINELNAKDNSKPLSLDRPRPLAVPFLDVSQDGYVSAQDALWVINYLNGRRSGEGEGEVPDATSVAGPMLLPEAPRIAFPRTLTRTSPSPTATTRGSMARYVIGQLPEIGFVATESIAEPGFWDEPDHNWMLPDLDSTLSEIADDLVEQWAVDEDGYPDRFRTNGRQCWRTPTLALSAER